jgi:hypothetical protein
VDGATSLKLLQGSVEGTKDHSVLSVGFSYQQVLGELIYPYVVCQLDIGFAVLACFGAAPALEHYQALKSTCKYLQAPKACVSAQSVYHIQVWVLFIVHTHR